MITFLPVPDFAESASMLDSKRLGNQRVEARMILRWLRNPRDYPRQQNSGYTVMWKGYEGALCSYYNACCEEWARRGGKNIVCQPERVGRKMKLPPWLGDEELHRTHRSALLWKLPEHYGRYGWADEISDPKVEYSWPHPTEEKEDGYELRPPKYWKKDGKSAAKSNLTLARTKPASGRARPKPPNKTTVRRKRSDAKNRQKLDTKRRPRRSPRLSEK